MLILFAKRANSFICFEWLMRSPPRLESRENPYSIDVTYYGEAAPKGEIFPPLKERTLAIEKGGGAFVSTEDRQNVIWLRNNFRA